MIPLLLSLPIGLCVAWAGFLLANNIEQKTLRAKLTAVLSWKYRQNQSLTFIWNRPLVAWILPFFRNQGFKDPELWSWGCWLGLEFSLLTPLLLGWNSATIFLGGLGGALYPLLWLTFQKRKKIASMQKDLPFLIDLLSIAVRAGMDLMQAVEKIVQTLPPSPLQNEFAKMAEDLKLGQTRKEALQSFKERMPLAEARAMASLLLQAVQLGTPLASVLSSSASQLRAKRFSRAERLGSQSAIKILFPLVFCMIPSLFLLIFSPLILRLMTQGVEGLLW